MASLMLVNPKRRRKSTRRKVSVKSNPRRKRRTTRKRRARRNPIHYANPRKRRTRRRARRNPKFSVRSIQRDALMPAAIGGVGALAIDVVYGALPIPANFKTGVIGSVAKIAVAVIAGKVAGKMLGAKVGEAMTVGAVTIQAYNAVKGFAQKQFPALPMGEYLSGDFPTYSQMGYMNPAPVSTEMLSYAPGSQSGMGEYLSDMETDSSGAYAY